MDKGINLLPNEQVEKSNSKTVLTLRILAGVFLLVIASLQIYLFSANVLSPVPQLQKESDQLVSQITQQNEKRISLAIIQNRTKNAMDLLSKRNDMKAQISTIIDKLTPDNAIDNASFDGKEIKLDISSSSLKSAEQLIANISSLKDEKKARYAKLSQISFGPKGGYAVSLDIQL